MGRGTFSRHRCDVCGHINIIWNANVLKGHCEHNWQLHWRFIGDVPPGIAFVWKEEICPV